MANFEVLSIDFFFGEDPKNSQNLEILSMRGKYNGIHSKKEIAKLHYFSR